MIESVTSALVWATFCLTAGGASFAMGRAVNLGRRMAAGIAVATGTAMLGALLLLRLFTQPGPSVVSITSPRTPMEVNGSRVRVRGTVRPAHARVTLLVRSERDDRWWVQTVVRPRAVEGTAGVWTIDALVGTAAEGQYQNFHLVALASSNSYWHDVISGHDLTVGRTLSAVPAWSQSDPVVIWRAR